MKYNTVIFDLDGTLLFTLEDLENSVNLVLRQEGCQQRTTEEIKAFIGNGAKMLMERSLPDGTPQVEILRCLTLFRRVYLENMKCNTKPYDGILDMLQELKAAGIKTAVVSNKPDDATREMCRIFFHDLIDAAIGDSPNRNRKPAPDNLFEILRQLQVNKDNTLYVGDSNTDMETAKNAGVACAGVTWGYRSRDTLVAAGANYIIDEPHQLIGLIKDKTGSQEPDRMLRGERK